MQQACKIESTDTVTAIEHSHFTPLLNAQLLHFVVADLPLTDYLFATEN